MDVDNGWAVPTEKLGNREKTDFSLRSQSSIQRVSLNNGPSLKKTQLIPLVDELHSSSLPTFEVASVPSPSPIIKPPPTVFIDLWGESENTPSEQKEVSQTNTHNLEHAIEGHQNAHVSEDTLTISEEIDILDLPKEEKSTLDELWENASEGENEEWQEEATSSLDDLELFDDLDLFDIDATLAKQEAEVQQQSYEQKRENTTNRERWGGISSLIYVNWEDAEAAEQDALTRLGYKNVPLSKETRAFIIQAARNARLPHRQEIQLTSQLAHSRSQLASLPPYNEEEAIDPYTDKRKALQTEIAKIEQILTSKMQWVAIKKAAQFRGQGVELDDLIQFGMEGVIAGIQHFDITRKARLLMAVNTWTFQAVTRAIAVYGSPIRLPAHMFELVNAATRQYIQWQRENEQLPTHQALAQKMGVSLKDLLNILKAKEISTLSKKSLSIEHLLHSEDLNEGYSFQEPEERLSTNDDMLADILAEIAVQEMQITLYQDLTPRERQVFSLRTGLNGDGGDGQEHTLEEIGKVLEITRERVRQIEDRAREKIIRQLQNVQLETPRPQKDTKVQTDHRKKYHNKGKARKSN